MNGNFPKESKRSLPSSSRIQRYELKQQLHFVPVRFTQIKKTDKPCVS